MHVSPPLVKYTATHYRYILLPPPPPRYTQDPFRPRSLVPFLGPDELSSLSVSPRTCRGTSGAGVLEAVAKCLGNPFTPGLYSIV